MKADGPYMPMGLLSEFPLLGEQLSKANVAHLPGVSLVMLRQVPAFVHSFWLVSRATTWSLE